MLRLPSGSRKKSNGKKRSNVPPKGSKRSKSLSTSYEDVYVTKKGKQFRKMTPHGKFIRNKVELENNANAFTGEVLTDYQRGVRAGYNQALGEQANYYNNSKQKKK